MTQAERAMTLLGVICLVGLCVAPLHAAEGHGGMMRGQMQSGHDQGEQDEHGGHAVIHVLKHAKEIGLTPEQVSKLKAIQLDFGRSQARAESDIKVAKLELHALADEEQTDLSAIQEKITLLKKAEGELLLAAIKSRRDATALLTPEQREKDRAHRERMQSAGERQHRGGMGGGMGSGMMGGGGHSGRGGDRQADGGQSGAAHQH